MKTLTRHTGNTGSCICGICAPDSSIYYRKVEKQHLTGSIQRNFLPGDYQIEIVQEEGNLRLSEVMRALKCLYRLAGVKLFCSMYERDRKIHILASYEDRIAPGELLLTLLHQNPRCDIRIVQATQKQIEVHARQMAADRRIRLLELNRIMEDAVWKRF